MAACETSPASKLCRNKSSVDAGLLTLCLADLPFARYSDAYHSCYVLSGLSSAQHKWVLVSARADAAMMDGDRWSVSPFISNEEQIFEEGDRVGASHPVYVIPQRKVDDCQQYFVAKTVF